MNSSLNKLLHTKITWPKEYWLMLVLCFLSFNIVSTAGGKTFFNAEMIMNHELFFIGMYFLLLRTFPPLTRIVRENVFTSVIVILWLLSITLSLYFSPFDLWLEYKAQQRYLQTLTHFAFFIIAWDFLYRYRPPLKWLYYTIAASSLYVIGHFVFDILSTSNVDAMDFFTKPPLNSHIRHTGYQVAAATTFFFAFFIRQLKLKSECVINFTIYTILWAFLFWLGGRGAAFSVLVSFALVSVVLFYKNISVKSFLFISLVAISLGVIISELTAVMHWNGVLQAFQRSLVAENINQLSTNRIKIWLTTWESVKRHFLFGLGPQGYFFMPTRIFGVQPHNVLLQFLVEWGVVGTVLFMFLLIKGFWVGFKRNILASSGYVDIYSLVAGAVIVTLSVHALFDGTYYHPQPSFYLVLAFAIWILPSPEKNK
jgi:O-antigen ligase